jgi:prepilin-type N-terminal cleavage/methylation domain-containing protein
MVRGFEVTFSAHDNHYQPIVVRVRMLTSDKGYTIIELLIALAIVGIVLTGIYDLAISSSRIYLAQNAIVEMQEDGRAAMDFLARELRLAFDNPTISTATTTDDTISFNRVEDTGYSSGGNSATTLNDTRKSWQSGIFGPSANPTYTVRIIRGTGNGQVRTIDDNSSTQLTISQSWGTVPDSTSVYVITRNKGFTRTSASDNVLRYRIGATGGNNPLAENITSHSFSQPNPNTIRITLTARTRNVDPNIKQYRYYILTENVRLRNM